MLMKKIPITENQTCMRMLNVVSSSPKSGLQYFGERVTVKESAANGEIKRPNSFAGKRQFCAWLLSLCVFLFEIPGLSKQKKLLEPVCLVGVVVRLLARDADPILRGRIHLSVHVCLFMAAVLVAFRACSYFSAPFASHSSLAGPKAE